MSEVMKFPDTLDEFIKQYSFIDEEQIYTNGSELIQTFRINQWEEHKKQENQELKKQIDKAHDELYTLKNKYNIRLLNQISENIEPDCEDYYLAEIETKAHKYDLIQNQQKEFIDYLGNEININPYDISDYDYEDIINTIISKYKEIIGDDK